MNPASAAPPRAHWRDRLLAFWARRRWRGFLRLERLLKPAGGRRGIQTPCRYGPHFRLSLWDSVDTHVLLEGFYESEVLEALRPALSATDAVLWVVGANFGLHAITAKFLHPSVRVVAFEPSPPMAARLLENAALNGVGIELHAYALSDADGLPLFYANASGNPGMSTLHPCAGFRYDQRFHVAACAPAGVIARGAAPAPTALLVDAEGAEEAILRGFGPLLSHPSLRRIVFEAPEELLGQSPRSALLESLRAAGFVLEKLDRRENTAHSLANFLALRR